jgi:protein TonB
MTMTALPRTWRQRRTGLPWAWLVGLIVAILVNAVIAVALSRSRQPPPPAAQPPMPVRRLNVEEPPPPPPPAAAQPVAEPVPVAIATPPPMPAFETTTAGDAAFALPDLAPGPLTALPLQMPAIAMPSLDAPPAPPVPGSAGGPIDQGAVLTSAFDLERHYPRAARLRGTTGTTTLRLAIGADGRVRTAAVVRSTPDGVFDAAAIRLARDLRFTPAQRAGQAVAVEQDLTVNWTMP